MSLNEEICVLCCQDIKFYATGSCDHPVCYECSTRMRVLCEQNECPICRNDMPLVIFTHQRTLFLKAPRCKRRNERYSIAFEDDEIETAFSELLAHVCPVCGSGYPSFENLSAHVRHDHTMFYCDLCVKNLKIFTFERRCYNRKDFAHHKRKGDTDNTSHRGHPLCEFCDERFQDLDELYRHLRREHYFCHFCDADGVQKTQFFSDYSYLRRHFLKDHYLCEEGDCVKEQFVAAFRSEIDLKAHIALTHTKNKSKAEVKQARTLDFEFPITPRNTPGGNQSPNYNEHRQKKHNARREHEETRNEATEESQGSKQNKKFNTQCVEDFPHLANGSVGRTEENFRESNMYANRISNDVNATRKPMRPASRQNIQIEEFPALAPAASQGKNKNMFTSANTAAQSTTSARAEKLSSHEVSGDQQQTFKWIKPIKERKNIIIASQSAQRLPNKTFSMEEFPKLETKEQVQFTSTARTYPQSSWRTLDAVPVESKDTVAQQISQKCKSKKKNKKSVSGGVANIQHVTPNDRTEALPLNRLYTGFTNHNVMGEDEEEEASKQLNLKIIDKIEKHRKDAEADDIPWREEVRLVDEDFPPLGPPPATDFPPLGPPPAVVKANYPPGFCSKNALNTANAPPGFSGKTTNSLANSFVSLSSIAQQLADTKEIYKYEPPTDFQKRNGVLIQNICEYVDSDNKLFDEFKSLSGDFRKSKISAADYYTSCMQLLGKARFLQLFPELLCLLPDIVKQQELLEVHSDFSMQENKNKGAVPKRKGLKIDSISSLSVCQTCHQVLMKKDFDTHTRLHKVQTNQ